MLPKHDAGHGSWDPRDPVSCVLTLWHTNYLNLVLTQDSSPGPPLPCGKFLLGLLVLISLRGPQSGPFYLSALGSVRWLSSLPAQQSAFANRFSCSPGPTASGLYRQSGGDGAALARPQEKFPIPPFSWTKGHFSDFSHKYKSLLQGDLLSLPLGTEEADIIPPHQLPFYKYVQTLAVTMASSDLVCHTPGHHVLARQFAVS